MADRFPRPFRGVVFDLDGTLVHSAPDIAAVLNIVLDAEGITTFAMEDTYRFIGHGAERLIADAFAARGQVLGPANLSALTRRYLAAYARRGSPDTVLYPGAAEAVRALHARDIPLAVCTNKAEALSRQVIAAFGLEGLFVTVIGSDSGFGRKPTAGPLAEACRRMGAQSDEVLMVGDTITDVHSAQAAKCAAAVVRNGYSQAPVETLGAEIVLNSVADVPELIAT